MGVRISALARGVSVHKDARELENQIDAPSLQMLEAVEARGLVWESHTVIQNLDKYGQAISDVWFLLRREQFHMSFHPSQSFPLHRRYVPV